MTCLSRRALIAATGSAAALVSLTACAGEPVRTSDATAPGDVVLPVADLPVGGAVELDLDGRRTLVTRPTEDDVRGWDAECPHQGCTVRALADGGLGCPCHGSAFDPATGDVLDGPAEEGLTPVALAVRGSDIVLG